MTIKYRLPGGEWDGNVSEGYITLHVRGGLVEFADEPDERTLAYIDQLGGVRAEDEPIKAKSKTKSEVTSDGSTDA